MCSPLLNHCSWTTTKRHYYDGETDVPRVYAVAKLHCPSVRSTNLPRLLFSEFLDRVVEMCFDYVLDSSARGRDWLTELGGVDITLRSHVRQGLPFQKLQFKPLRVSRNKFS